MVSDPKTDGEREEKGGMARNSEDHRQDHRLLGTQTRFLALWLWAQL